MSMKKPKPHVPASKDRLAASVEATAGQIAAAMNLYARQFHSPAAREELVASGHALIDRLAFEWNTFANHPDDQVSLIGDDGFDNGEPVT